MAFKNLDSSLSSGYLIICIVSFTSVPMILNGKFLFEKADFSLLGNIIL